MTLDDMTLSTAPTARELAGHDLSDLGHAMRLIRLIGGTITPPDRVDARNATLLYVIGMGWIGYNGRHWDFKYGEVLARRAAHMVSQKMRDPEVRGHLSDHGLDKREINKMLNAMGQAGASSAMLKQAESYLTVEIDAFDADPMVLNCQNCTLKLGLGKDGKVKVEKRGHNAADRLTRMLATDYEPKAQAPLFREVWTTSLPLDHIAACFRRMIGYSFTGQVEEEIFSICQGKGQDGKSTLLDALREMAGSYGGVGDINTFLEVASAGASGASPDLIKLAGDVRFVVLSEPPRGARFNEGRLKAWTSGSPITARQLREAPIDFRPIGKLWIECNPLPAIRGDDDGIWRRAKVVPFEHQVPDDKRDRRLKYKLRAEFAGILNWVLEGVADWLRDGIAEPPDMKRILLDYRKESSPFGDWLISRCVFGDAAKGERTLSKDLHADFKAWQEEQGVELKTVMSVKSFGTALTQRQIRPAGQNSKGLQYRGPIRLKRPDELEADIVRANSGWNGPVSATPKDDPYSMEGSPFE